MVPRNVVPRNVVPLIQACRPGRTAASNASPRAFQFSASQTAQLPEGAFRSRASTVLSTRQASRSSGSRSHLRDPCSATEQEARISSCSLARLHSRLACANHSGRRQLQRSRSTINDPCRPLFVTRNACRWACGARAWCSFKLLRRAGYNQRGALLYGPAVTGPPRIPSAANAGYQSNSGSGSAPSEGHTFSVLQPQSGQISVL